MQNNNTIYNSLRVEILKLYLSSTELFLFLIGCIGALTLLCAILLFWVRQLLQEVSYLRLEFTNLKHDTELIISNFTNEIHVFKSYEVVPSLSIFAQVYNIPWLTYTNTDFIVVGFLGVLFVAGTVTILGTVSVYFCPRLLNSSFIDQDGNQFFITNSFFDSSKKEILVKLFGDSQSQSVSNYIQNSISNQSFKDETGNLIEIVFDGKTSHVMVQIPSCSEILSIGDVIKRASENLSYTDKSGNIISMLTSSCNANKKDLLFQLKNTECEGISIFGKLAEGQEALSLGDWVALTKYLMDFCSHHSAC